MHKILILVDRETETVEKVKELLLEEHKDLEKEAHLIMGAFYLEILPPGTHKAEGLKALCDELKVCSSERILQRK